MKTNEFITAGLIGSGMTALAGALIFARGKKEERRAVESLSKKLNINVEDAVLRDAVNAATDRAVTSRVDAMANRAVNDIRNDISNAVNKTVNNAYSDVKKDVKDRLNLKVSALDISDIKKEVLDSAKDEAIKVLTKELKSVVGGHHNKKVEYDYDDYDYDDDEIKIKIIQWHLKDGLKCGYDSDRKKIAERIYDIAKENSWDMEIHSEAIKALMGLCDVCDWDSSKKTIRGYIEELV